MKSFFDMTDEEVAKKAALTESEQTAVDAFLMAAKALPKSLYIQIDDAELCVGKRITPSSGKEVAKIRKASLKF